MSKINLIIIILFSFSMKIIAQTNSDILKVTNIIIENNTIIQGEEIKVTATVKNISPKTYNGDLILSLHNSVDESLGDIDRLNNIKIFSQKETTVTFFQPGNLVKWDTGNYILQLKHTYGTNIYNLETNDINIEVKKPQYHYKIGVVLFDRLNLDIEKEIDKIILEIAENKPHRELNNKKLDLVIQLEVSWNQTNPQEQIFNFERLKQIAKIFQEKGIKWTPLLSVHYIPNWARDKYEKHLLRDTKGEIIPINQTQYLRFSPSSSIWSLEIKNWIGKFIESLNSYIGKGNVIEEILIANEMMYPDFNKSEVPDNPYLYSNDEATINSWKAKNYNIDLSNYKTISDVINEKDKILLNFKAEELSYAIASMTISAIRKLNEMGKNNVGVSSKLFPYYFPDNKNLSDFNIMKGYTDSSLGHLDNNFRSIFAIDSYPNNYCQDGTRSLIQDYDITIHLPDRNYKRTLKDIYVAEFNRPFSGSCKNYSLNSTDVFNAIITGTNQYNVKYFTFFAWNSDSSTYEYNITEEQKKGMRKAFNSIIPIKKSINNLILYPTITKNYSYLNIDSKEVSSVEVINFRTLKKNRIKIINDNNLTKINLTNISKGFYSLLVTKVTGEKYYFKFLKD